MKQQEINLYHVGGYQATCMVHLGKTVAFLFVHFKLHITSVFYFIAEVEISII